MQEPEKLGGATRQLAEDLAWLEGHARSNAKHAAQAGMLRLAAAAVRNVLTPFAEGQPASPLHVAVVGGAGAGKSTVANMLCGKVVAESNPQAGFTRHPVAYVSGSSSPAWPGSPGFLGPLRLLDRPEPSNLDSDVYQIRRVSEEPDVPSVLDRFIVWDCPDMTTWAAEHYAPRLLEIAGLADVVVYVASDERYNDKVPTDVLREILRLGKTVVVCLVKMREADAHAFVELFRKEVAADMPRPPVAILTIPQFGPAELADPIRAAARYRIPLLNQISALTPSETEARNRSVNSTLSFLRSDSRRLLECAQEDLHAIEGWRKAVVDGRTEFDDRYLKEYLTTERFRRFDEALVKLLDLLELPGVGTVISGALYVLRTPYRLLSGLVKKAVSRPETGAIPERQVLEQAFTGWTDGLRREAIRQADVHPVWKHVATSSSGQLGEQARAKFEEAFRGFQLNLADEVNNAAKAIYQDLEKNPVALNTLRGAKFTMEVASIAGTVAVGGLNPLDIVLVPVAASLTHQLVELLGKQYVDHHRERIRERQRALVGQFVSGPVGDWLANWPTSGGSPFEQLQRVMHRIPLAIQQSENQLRQRMEHA